MKDDDIGTFSLRSIQLIDEKIRRCPIGQERLVLFAKRAGGLAAHSYIAEAKATIAELREKNTNNDPQLTGWINLAEGQVEHFETLDNKKSKNKFNRAMLISQMVSDRELAGACAAWVAHCDFVDGNIKMAAVNITNSFEWSLPDEHETRGRASMLLADAFNAIDQISTSRTWFRIARNHASQAGDIAMQNVMLFNIAAYSVSRLTLDDCTTGASPSDMQRTTMEVASASNLNSALGIAELPTMIPTMQLELQIVQKKWKQALDIFENHPSQVLKKSPVRLIPKLVAQRAWCYANTGDLAAAAVDFNDALNSKAQCTDDDDLAILYFRLFRVSELINQPEVTTSCLIAADKHLTLFREHQEQIRAMLETVTERISGQ
jgi:hypothetical protein